MNRDLALHRYAAEPCRAVVFYIHGIQSHAGWLFETGPALARSGVELVALDRRGSGASSGRRGDVETHQQWLDDYRLALAELRASCKQPLVLLGQSMGGVLALRLALDAPELYDRLVLCAPALGATGTLREEPDPDRDYPLNFPDSFYTRDPDYLEFIAKDTLMLRHVTGRTRCAVANARGSIHDGLMAGARVTKPALLVLPRTDRIIDLAQAREVFAEATNGRGRCIELPCDDHYVEFSDQRARYWDLLSSFAVTGQLHGRAASPSRA